jgi:hypothetical protein
MAGTQGKMNNMASAPKKKQVRSTKQRAENNSKYADRDWIALREEWVTTNITLMGLAQKYGIPFTTVRYKYQFDHWSKFLEEYNGMVDDAIYKAKKAKAESIAQRVVELDEMVLATSERILSVISDQMDEVLVTSKRPDIKDVISVLKHASDAMKNVHYNIRLSADKATQIVDNRIESSLPKEEEERIASELGLLRKQQSTNTSD